jgi:hypothetical protein
MTEMRATLRALTSVDDAGRFTYLTPLFELSKRQGVLTVVTLNYDCSVEGLGKLLGVPIDIGMPDADSAGDWAWTGEEGIRLLKLHGSMDWSIDHRAQLPGRLPEVIVVRSEQPLVDRREPAIVFGQRGKLRAEGPFLNLLHEFDTSLMTAQHLVVVGYSFRDEHVNECVRRWINRDEERHITVVDPAFSPELNLYPSASFASQLATNLVARDLPTRPADFASRLTVIRQTAQDGLAEALGLSPDHAPPMTDQPT